MPSAAHGRTLPFPGISGLPSASLEVALGNCPEPFCALDRDWRFSYVNTAYTDLLGSLGLSARSLEGHVPWEVFPELAGSKFHVEAMRSVSEGRPIRFTEFYPQHPSWWEVRLFPTGDGAYAWFHDITPKLREGELSRRLEHVQRQAEARRHTEAAVRESERRLRQITEAVPAACYVTQVSPLRLLYVSPAYEQVWQRPVEELYADPAAFVRAVHPEDRPRLFQALKHVRFGDPMEEAYRLLRADGELRRIRHRAFPVADESGRVYRIVGIAEDVTDTLVAAASPLPPVGGPPAAQLLGALQPLIAPLFRERGVSFVVRERDGHGMRPFQDDRDRLVQICVELLSNALRAKPSGGTILVWCNASDGSIALRVQDEGVRTAPAAEPRESIFGCSVNA